MKNCYFLGANSKDGFASLYHEFAAGDGDRLHVIKGGPGTGKSGFMKKLGASAERRGYDVEYVLCSGDPDSLDGVYIPALKEGWVDGTAPHVLDPKYFGASGDYLNLGSFCRLPLSAADSAEVLRLNRAYKALYGCAYAYLSAASDLRRAGAPDLRDAALREQVCRRVDGVLKRHTLRRESASTARTRFLSAISCQGQLRLTEALSGYSLVYQLDDGYGLAAAALDYASAQGSARGLSLIRCPSPLDPTETEALLLPEDGVALLRGDWGIPNARHIRLDALVPSAEQKTYRPELRRARRLEREAQDAAVDALRQAKALHDELEAVYRPYMDFDALSAFTEQEIDRIFS